MDFGELLRGDSRLEMIPDISAHRKESGVVRSGGAVVNFRGLRIF